MYDLQHYIFWDHSACIKLQLELNDGDDVHHTRPKLSIFDLKDPPKYQPVSPRAPKFKDKTSQIPFADGDSYTDLFDRSEFSSE